jgi:hypothetical protein
LFTVIRVIFTPVYPVSNPTGSDGRIAAVLVALPVLAVYPLYARLPETLGMELEESAPD